MKNSELKKRRNEMGLTQVELAIGMGMKIDTYRKIESGVNIPNMKSIILMSKFFKLSVDDIVKWFTW